MRWLFKILPSPTPRTGEHVSVWSVLAHDAKTFFHIVGTLWVLKIAFLARREKDRWPWGSDAGDPPEEVWMAVGEFAFVVLVDFGRVCIAITIVAMLLTRALNSTGELTMSLYQAMVNRFVIPVIEGHRAEGRAQGRAEVGTEWRAWNKRRIAAEREGREFTEPPPED